MDDLIRRSDAIKAVREYAGRYTFNAYHNGMLKAASIIASIPSADRPQEWIPCSEKLPEADGLYLATFTLIGIPKFSNVESFKNGKWEYHNGYIIAWMPLPKPWKGADDEVR